MILLIIQFPKDEIIDSNFAAPYIVSYKQTNCFLQMKIGQKIQRVREIKGLKQISVAKSLEITQQRLSQIEQAEEINDKLLKKIAKALNTTCISIQDFEEGHPINSPHTFPSDQGINSQKSITDKIIEIYEKLLQEKDKRIEFLQNQLSESK